MAERSGERTEPQWVVIENPSVPDLARQVALAVVSIAVVVGLAAAAILWH